MLIVTLNLNPVLIVFKECQRQKLKVEVHTSTATVLVLPDVIEADIIEIPDSDLTIETHRASVSRRSTH